MLGLRIRMQVLRGLRRKGLMSTPNSKGKFAVVQLDDTVFKDDVGSAIEEAVRLVRQGVPGRYQVVKLIARVNPTVEAIVHLEPE